MPSDASSLDAVFFLYYILFRAKKQAFFGKFGAARGIKGRCALLAEEPLAFADAFDGKARLGDAGRERLIGQLRFHKDDALFELCLGT